MVKDNFSIVKERVLTQISSKEYKLAYDGKEQGILDKTHFLEVTKLVEELWNKKEKTKLPIALQIAGLCHDLDRIYPSREVNTKNVSPEDYNSRKMIHSANSALIFYETNIDIPKELLRDVCFLIFRHEVGGDKDNKNKLLNKNDEFTNSFNLNSAANYLYYADKLSFFINNINEYAKRGKEKLKQKIKFSINGLPSWVIKEIRKIKFEDKNILEIINSLKV